MILLSRFQKQSSCLKDRPAFHMGHDKGTSIHFICSSIPGLTAVVVIPGLMSMWKVCTTRSLHRCSSLDLHRYDLTMYFPYSSVCLTILVASILGLTSLNPADNVRFSHACFFLDFQGSDLVMHFSCSSVWLPSPDL